MLVTLPCFEYLRARCRRQHRARLKAPLLTLFRRHLRHRLRGPQHRRRYRVLRLRRPRSCLPGRLHPHRLDRLRLDSPLRCRLRRQCAPLRSSLCLCGPRPLCHRDRGDATRAATSGFPRPGLCLTLRALGAIAFIAGRLTTGAA